MVFDVDSYVFMSNSNKKTGHDGECEVIYRMFSTRITLIQEVALSTGYDRDNELLIFGLVCAKMAKEQKQTYERQSWKLRCWRKST